MNKSRRQAIKIGAACLTTICNSGSFSFANTTVPSNNTRYHETAQYTGAAFGTQWCLTLERKKQQELIPETIAHTVEVINRSMSPYRNDSELTIFNNIAADKPFEVSPGFSKVVRNALDVAHASQGAFDPTVGPWVNRLGFGPVKGNFNSKYTDIVLSDNRISKRLAGATLDLCGIAKGYALDLISEQLHSLGVNNFLLDIGGEIYTRGKHPNGRDWLIAIDTPDNNLNVSMSTDSLNSSIATSGSTYNGYHVGNKHYSHLIGKHRQSRTSTLHSVSVMHPSAMLADAWSTALFVMGDDASILARAMKLDCLFVEKYRNRYVARTEGNFTLANKEDSE